MKATHNKDERALAEYPKLMRSHNGELVVLFGSKGVGTVLIAEGSYVVGEHNTNWLMREFIPLHSTESVTLQND
jgi:hypothetical protein